MTKNADIYKCLLENFEFMNEECEYLEIPLNNKELQRRNSFQFQLKMFFKMKILRKKKYIKRYNSRYTEKEILSKVTNLVINSDRCFVIRPDLYPKKIIL